MALSPEIAVTVGSASVLATPCRSKACKVAEIVLLPLVQPSVRFSGATTPLIAKGLLSVRAFGVVAEMLCMLTPSCFSISRRTSVTVTRSDTWSSPRMTSELMTFPESGVPVAVTVSEAAACPVPPPDGAAEAALEAPPRTDVPMNPLAMSRAFWASPAEATVPIKMTESATVLT